MNSLDILFVILLTWGGYSGFKKGFISELVSSVLLVFGLIKGVTIFYSMLPIVEQYFPFLSTSTPICLGVLMFLIGGGVIYLLSKMIKVISNITFLGIFDSLLGVLLGVAKAAFLISLLIYFWNFTESTALLASYIDNSTLFLLLEAIVPKILKSIANISMNHTYIEA